MVTTAPLAHGPLFPAASTGRTRKRTLAPAGSSLSRLEIGARTEPAGCHAPPLRLIWTRVRRRTPTGSLAVQATRTRTRPARDPSPSSRTDGAVARGTTVSRRIESEMTGDQLP